MHLWKVGLLKGGQGRAFNQDWINAVCVAVDFLLHCLAK
jgi:hypothetical protein